jgi:fibronectin type 3 domain-containing protein
MLSRSVAAAAVGLCLLVATPLVGTPAAYANPPAGGMSGEALTALFQTYGDTSGQWSGADGAASVLLPDGRIVWLFSDTLIGLVNPDHSRPRSAVLVNNSMVVQDGAALVSTLYGGSAGAPTALVRPTASDEMYWASDGIVEGSSLKVIYGRFRKTGTGLFDFERLATTLVTFALPGLTVSSVVDLPVGTTVSWGSALLEDGGYTYIYGAEFADSGMRFAHVARVPAGGLSGPWQFWNGTGWSPNAADSARLISGVHGGFGVQRVGSQYVLVTGEGNLPFSPEMVAYTSPTPTGPFSGPVHLFTAPEPGVSPTQFVYDPRLHPELARAGKLLVSYNVNTVDGDECYNDAHVCRPRFVEVDWPLPPPAGTVPAAPTGLTATTDETGTAHLSWQAPAGSGLSYTIYQRDVTSGQTGFARLQTGVTQTHADVGALRTGRTYEFRVTAVNASGEGPPSTVASVAINITPPPAPTGLAATESDTGDIQLTWTAVPNAWNYTVYRRDVTAGETAFMRLSDPTPTDTTYIARDLTNQHTYEFYVIATHGGGDSPPSATVAATATHAVSSAPTGLTATSLADGRIRLDWSSARTDVWYIIYQRDLTAGDVEFTKMQLPVTQCCTMTAGLLTDNHEYEFRVTALTPGGESAPSNTARATSHYPPTPPPTGLTATALADGRIRLDWTAGGPDQWFIIYQRDVTAGETSLTALPLPVTECCTMTAGLLTNGHEYEFAVSALGSGVESARSNLARAVAHYPVPPAPANLRVTPGDGQATLTWDSSGPDLWYVVYLRDVTAGEPGFTALPLPVTECCTLTAGMLTNGHSYQFRVTALGPDTESAPSNTVSAVPNAPLPAAPSGLTATARSDGTIALSWTAPGPDLWYVVYLRDVTIGQSWQRLPLPVTTCCTFTAGQLTDGHQYDFKVAALAPAGEGPASSPVRATCQYQPPPAPANLRGVSAGDGSIDLTWDPVGDVFYWVYMRDVTAGQTTFTKSTIPATDTSTSRGGLVNGHTYEFKVSASNPGGEGPASTPIQVVSHGGVPAPPSNLTATAGDREVILRWTASPTPNVWYVIYVRDATTGQSWQRLPLPVTTCCTMTAGMLTNTHTYQFKVTAMNASGDSAPSNEASARPMPPLPGAPTGLTALAGNGRVTLNWTASASPDVWYTVYQRDDTTGQSWQKLPLPVTSCCSMTAGYLVNGHRYEFKVTATNAAGESAASNVASARPLPPFPQPPTNLNASAGNGRVSLTWSASPTAGVWYAVYLRDVTTGQAWQRLPLPITGCCSINVGWLFNGHTYEFKVTAFNEAGQSQPSNTIRARPMPPFPSPPSGLSATPSSPGKVLLRWNASPTPNVAYKIWYRLAGDLTWNLASWFTFGTQFTVGWLVEGEVHEFMVTADNLTGESTYSNFAVALVDWTGWSPTRWMNNLNGSNGYARLRANGHTCRPGLGQTVCFSTTNGLNSHITTVGDYLLYPYSESTFNQRFVCEAYKRADIRYTYGRAIADQYGPNLLRHEAVHSGQWATYPTITSFVFWYVAAVRVSDHQYHNYWEGNSFEINANLYWGGYKTFYSTGHFPLC